MRIVFWNCGGTGNLGDDLCHLGAVEWCRRTYGEFEAYRIFRLNQFSRDIVQRADLLVIGGGGLLYHSDEYLRKLVEFGTGGAPYIFLGVGVGREFATPELVRQLTPMEWIVRNQESAQILREAGARNVKVAPDLSMLLQYEPQPKNGRAALNLKDTGDWNVEELAGLLDQFPDELDLLSFNSTDRHTTGYRDGERVSISDSNDTSLLLQLSRTVKRARDVEGYHYQDPLEFASGLSRYSYMVTERLHAAILAFKLGIPFRAIAYHSKVDRFLKENGLEHCRIEPDPKQIFKALYDLRLENRESHAVVGGAV